MKVHFGIVLKRSIEPDILLWSMFLKSAYREVENKVCFLFIIVVDL